MFKTKYMKCDVQLFNHIVTVKAYKIKATGAPWVNLKLNLQAFRCISYCWSILMLWQICNEFICTSKKYKLAFVFISFLHIEMTQTIEILQKQKSTRWLIVCVHDAVVPYCDRSVAQIRSEPRQTFQQFELCSVASAQILCFNSHTHKNHKNIVHDQDPMCWWLVNPPAVMILTWFAQSNLGLKLWRISVDIQTLLQQLSFMKQTLGNICDLSIKLNFSTVEKAYTSSVRKNSEGHAHDDVIKWKHFPRYWPFVRGIHLIWGGPANFTELALDVMLIIKMPTDVREAHYPNQCWLMVCDAIWRQSEAMLENQVAISI